MRTTTDGNDEKSPGEGSADRSSPQNIKHIRTSYCEFTYETNEMNTSFADNISKDAISKVIL